jgi:integrase
MERLPAPRQRQHHDDDLAAHEVWLRINAFLDQKSANTQRTYTGIIREWCTFLGAEAGTNQAADFILNATDLHAMAYKKWLEGNPGQKPRLHLKPSGSREISKRSTSAKQRDGLQSTLSNATIAKKFAALRRLYRMLIATNLGLDSNPFDTDRIPPPPARSGQKRPTEMIDFSIVKEILSLPDPSSPKGLRDLAALSLLFGGGLRRSELVALRIGDVRETASGTCYVRLRSTKAKKDVDHAVPGWTAKNIKKLINIRKADGAGSGDFLFISFRGPGGNTPTEKPLSDSGLYKLFKSYCQRAGTGNFVTPHSARATAITKLLSDGLNHREVQEFSRHASVQMVEVYDKRRLSIDESPAKGLDYED